MKNPVPRVAAIHDLSGFGRTSLTVVIPVLSSLGVQACPLPSAVLSTHTVEYTDFTLLDLSEEMERILDHWERLGLRFQAVYSGFTASVAQMGTVARCIERCLEPGGLAVVDPVLGDNGVLDATMTPEMVAGMRELVRRADVITPNYTEVTLLLGEDWRSDPDLPTVLEQLRRLAGLGPRVVVATSVPLPARPGYNAVLAYEREGDRYWKIENPLLPVHYPGTGDAFAAALTGGLVCGDSLPLAMERAARFANLGIRASFGLGMPTREGIVLERILPTLRAPMLETGCEIISLETARQLEAGAEQRRKGEA